MRFNSIPTLSSVLDFLLHRHLRHRWTLSSHSAETVGLSPSVRLSVSLSNSQIPLRVLLRLSYNKALCSILVDGPKVPLSATSRSKVHRVVSRSIKVLRV